MEDGFGRSEKILLWKRLLLRQQDPRPISLREACIGPVPCFEDGNHVEHSESLHVLRMIQGHAVADASSAVVTDQREGRKSEIVHHFYQFLCHCALGIRKVIVGRSRDSAAAVGAKVYANYGVIVSKLGREKSPHQAGAGEAVHQENWRPTSVATNENLVP